MKPRVLCRALVAAAALLAWEAGSARAQPVALPRFHPSFAGDRFWGTPSAYAPGDLTLHAALFADLAHLPLLARRVTDGDPVSAIVRSQAFLHANATFSFRSRVAVNVEVPVAVRQSGDEETSPDSAAFGDVRLGVRAAIVGDAGSPFQLGAGGYFWLPTGTDDFVTDGAVRGLPFVVAGGRLDRLVWSLALGVELRPDRLVNEVPIGPSFWGSAAIGAAAGATRRVQIGLEASFSVALQRPEPANTHAELLAQLRYRFHPDLEAALGFGPGLTTGIGTPDFRGIIGLVYTPQIVPGLRDTDGDDVIDSLDACPRVPGLPSDDPAKEGCPLGKPPPDTDGDGIPDARDACPGIRGVPSGDPSRQGCPIEPVAPYLPPEPEPEEPGEGGQEP